MSSLASSHAKNASSNQPLTCGTASRLMLIGCLVLASTLGCEPCKQALNQSPGASNNRSSNTIVTASYPIEWVTREIVGSEYEVNFPAGESEQPDRWRPDRETIAEIQAADLIVCNGIAAPYASWLKTVSLPSSKVIQSASKGLALADFISVEDIQIVHSHGPEGEHSHPTMVSRTWLDPAMLIKQANYITEQLCKQRPDNAAKFKENLANVTEKLKSIAPQSLDEQTVPVFSVTPELKFLTRAAGINDLHFNWNPDTTLAQAQANLAAQESEVAPKFILFPKRLMHLAERLKPLLQQQKLEPIFIDLLDRPIANGDFVKRLTDNITKVQKIASAPNAP